MARPATLDPDANTKLIGFQASEEFRLRLKVAAARRGLSMKDALHDAVELWISTTEDDAFIADAPSAQDPAAGFLVRGVTSRELERPRIRRAIKEEEEEDGDEDDEAFPELDDEEESDGLSHGDELIVEDEDEE